MGGQLDAVRIVDFSIWRPGPYCTQLLAEMGATVIKVEPPGGDPMRVFPELFAMLHAGKRSVVIDLRADGGLERAHSLIEEADVLVEGFRPGVMDRLGLGADDVRGRWPALVYCSISGFGQTGELVEAPGHDIDYQAYAGLLAPRGGEPIVSPVPLADLAGGAYGALAVCAALVRRAATGEGERIDVAMTDVLATWTGPLEATTVAGSDRPLDGLPSYGVFLTADDRWVTLGIISEDHLWRPLCDELGLPHLRNLDMAGRVERGEEVRAALRDAIRGRERDELVAALSGSTALSPVLARREMLGLPHLRERGVVVDDGSGATQMGHPVRFEDRPATRHGRAPELDEHAAEPWGRHEPIERKRT